ncbi:MAG: hypothetical protein IH609_17205 [Dehalococcoidia bacterium]|nr:hypothetical protein [Dehalococcoidia bacterium]
MRNDAQEPAKMGGVLRLMVVLYRPFVRRAARQALQGRRIDPSRPEAGRFLRADVTAFVDDVWRRIPAIMAGEDFAAIPTTGNKNNVFLAGVTIAAYQALLDRGIERKYAMELFGDMGWKLYESMVKVPLLFASATTFDSQQRMDRVLRWLMRFPFSTPGRPGYEVRAWATPGRFNTHWAYCAPLGFTQRYVQAHGDRGEVEAFYRSWCLYDWPVADLLAGGKAGDRDHYERPHTLSLGDSVCDMCWHAAGSAALRRAPSP